MYFKIIRYLRNTGHSDNTPPYLKGHPKSIILHCLQRKLKFHKFSVEDIIMLDGGSFEVHKTGTEKNIL